MTIEANQIKFPEVNGPVNIYRLEKKPYQREIVQDGKQVLIDCNVTAANLARESNYPTVLDARLAIVEPLFGTLFKDSAYHTIDKKLKHGQDLTFEETFTALTFVCAALNQPLRDRILSKMDDETKPTARTHSHQAAALLTALSMKEVYKGLTPEEIAGAVAATIHIDTFIRMHHSDTPIMGIGGMGGDKGYTIDGKETKFFSLSTLASLALAVDLSVHKHHSYPNTSKVAGQSAIEAMGARSDFHYPDAMTEVIRKTGLLMSSCHDTRTLHTLSHILKGETINHVIGPLAFPVSPDTPINAMIGVNEKIHPEVMVEAMRILTKKGFQKYYHGAVFCGTDLKEVSIYDLLTKEVKQDLFFKHVLSDEIAPPPFASIVAFMKEGENMGTFVLLPEDFYTDEELVSVDIKKIAIPNTEQAIIEANKNALTGDDEAKARYLAMTVGLGIFVSTKLSCSDSLNYESRRVNKNYLRDCTKRALEIIKDGYAKRKLDSYIHATNQFAGWR